MPEYQDYKDWFTCSIPIWLFIFYFLFVYVQFIVLRNISMLHIPLDV